MGNLKHKAIIGTATKKDRIQAGAENETKWNERKKRKDFKIRKKDVGSSAQRRDAADRDSSGIRNRKYGGNGTPTSALLHSTWRQYCERLHLR